MNREYSYWEEIYNAYGETENGSFGFETGLIEIMGCIVPECVSDSVEGHLTANEVIERIEKYYASNGLVINN